MVIPFRRTIWSSSRSTSTLGDDRVFVTLWSGRRPGVAGFRPAFWAMDDQHNGLVRRTAAAQSSNNGESWDDLTLSPVAPTAQGTGLNVATLHTLVDGKALPYVRIGLIVERGATPTGSCVQTIEGHLTLIGESV
jgi:hypothetical protein